MRERKQSHWPTSATLLTAEQARIAPSLLLSHLFVSSILARTLSMYYVPGTLLGAGDSEVNMTELPGLAEPTVQQTSKSDK